jgi:hypothetical protein
MTVQTSTGTIFSAVADVPATHDETGFSALTFSEVGEVTDIPEYGPNVQVVEHNPLKSGVTEKYKGFINYGSTSIQLGQDSSDAGQTVLSDGVTGSTKNDEHSFKIEFQDGTVDYFTGKVFSYTTNPSSANSIVGSTAMVEINSTVVRVLPGS